MVTGIRRPSKSIAGQCVRRLTLRDLMGLVAATAIAIWLAKWILPDHLVPRQDDRFYFRWIFTGPSTFLVTLWVAILIVLRLSRPRPDRK